jgi:AcrR family transcriptional regulator
MTKQLSPADRIPRAASQRRRGRPRLAEAVADRHDGLLQAAMTVMARDGLAGASTRAIAEAAGVNKAMLHYSFADKDALLMAVLDHILSDVRETLTRAAAGAPDQPVARMVALMRAYWHHVEATPALQRVQYELTLYALSQASHAELAQQQYAGYVELIVGVIGPATGRKRAAVRTVAELVLATLDGLILQFLANPSRPAAQRRLNAAISALSPQIEALMQVLPD